MHLVATSNQVSIGAGVALQPGHYLMDDSDAAQLMAMAGGGECKLQYWGTSPAPLPGPDGHDTITIIRPGRYGDLILLTPCLREIKRRWPNKQLQVACLPHYRDALIGLPYIDSFLEYPVPMESNMGHVVSLEVLSSLAKRERELHMTDLFASRLGIESIANKKPDFILTQDERNWAFDAYPRSKKNRVAIQVKSSTPSRDYPPAKMAEVIRMLIGRKWDVVLIGLPHEISGDSPDITNCAKDNLTFRQSAAVIATAPVFLGPDSSMIHVAGALGTPAVGLFSVVPWSLRTSYCPTTFVIQAKQGCDIAPCFHAPRALSGFPTAGPCAKVRKCYALDEIEPQAVVSRVEQSVR